MCVSGVARLGGRSRIAVGYPMPGRAELNGRAVGWQPAYRARMTMPMVYHNLRIALSKGAKGAPAYVYAVVDNKAQLTVRRHVPDHCRSPANLDERIRRQVHKHHLIRLALGIVEHTHLD